MPLPCILGEGDAEGVGDTEKDALGRAGKRASGEGGGARVRQVSVRVMAVRPGTRTRSTERLLLPTARFLVFRPSAAPIVAAGAK